MQSIDHLQRADRADPTRIWLLYYDSARSSAKHLEPEHFTRCAAPPLMAAGTTVVSAKKAPKVELCKPGFVLKGELLSRFNFPPSCVALLVLPNSPVVGCAFIGHRTGIIA